MRRILSIVAGAFLMMGIATSATASPSDEIQDRIDEVMSAFPGGVQTSWNTVSWDDGETVLTLAQEGGLSPFAAVGTCASGNFCVYSSLNGLGSKLSFSTCGVKDVSPLGSAVRSVANARSSGNVLAKNGTTTVLTVGPGSIKNTTATVKTVQC